MHQRIRKFNDVFPFYTFLFKFNAKYEFLEAGSKSRQETLCNQVIPSDKFKKNVYEKHYKRNEKKKRNINNRIFRFC